MSSQRIDSLQQPLPAGVASLMQKLIPPGMTPPRLFAAFAKNEGLFGFLVNAGIIGPAGLLDRRALPRELRECLILRTATCQRLPFSCGLGTVSASLVASVVAVDVGAIAGTAGRTISAQGSGRIHSSVAAGDGQHVGCTPGILRL